MAIEHLSRPLKLGKAVLDEYLSPIEEPTGFPFPEIDHSFLNMRNTLKINGHNIPLPRFSVYPAYGSFFFNVGFREFREGSKRENYLCATGLPLELENTLLDSTRDFVSDDSSNFWRRITGVPKIGNVNVYSMFSGIVPQKTKKRIYEASKIFDNDKLYFVKETRPGDWNVEVLPDSETFFERVQRLGLDRDPLVLGAKDGKYFVVGHFDVTPWEEYALKEFGTSSI